jgi:hypothetical protein
LEAVASDQPLAGGIERPERNVVDLMAQLRVTVEEKGKGEAAGKSTPTWPKKSV